jgi:inhibitor of cysteine peptidase
MTRKQWTAVVALGAIALGLMLAVVLVQWGDGAPAATAPAVYHDGDSVTVKQGSEFVVVLPANPSTGYSWTAADNPDVAFVTSKQIPGGDQPGASGTQELTFRATTVGRTTLDLGYARPFEHDVPPVKTAEFPVEVDR